MSKSIFVEGRKWLDRSAGNTYWSSRVWVDGSVAFQLPMNYGYGEMYLQYSLEECVKRGYLPEHHSISELRQRGIVLYTSASQVLKREMFRRWTPESDK
jgi:hypothetical protein